MCEQAISALGWYCSGCNYSLPATDYPYERMARDGSPVCSTCDADMELVDLDAQMSDGAPVKSKPFIADLVKAITLVETDLRLCACKLSTISAEVKILGE